MTVRAGREFLAVPGPTNIPDEVLQAMHRPAVEIYSEPLIALTDSLLRDLSKLFDTAGRTYIYIANGHGAWEAALTNVLSRGDKILVLENGKFGHDWGEAAARLGIEVEFLNGDWRRARDPRPGCAGSPRRSPSPHRASFRNSPARSARFRVRRQPACGRRSNCPACRPLR